MSKVQNILIVVLTLLLLVVYGLFGYWKNRAIKAEGLPPQVVTVVSPATAPDTVKITVRVPYAVTESVQTVIYVPANIDTAAIVADYLNVKRSYSDVFKDDSSAYIAYNLQVYQNKLHGLNFDFVNRQPRYINTIVHSNSTLKLQNRGEFCLYGTLGNYVGYWAPGATVTLPNGMYFEYKYLLNNPAPHYGAIGFRVLRIRAPNK